MGEWALVLGLALKQTTGRFRPRDGRPRGPSAMGDLGYASAEPALAAAEVRASATEATAADGARTGSRNGDGVGAPYRSPALADKPPVAQREQVREAPPAWDGIFTTVVRGVFGAS